MTDEPRSREEEIEQAIVDVLRPAQHPVLERVVLDNVCRRLAGDHVDWDEAKRVLNDLHASNRIRWVAFDGWAYGGRPGV